jgi:hypothetical protein
MHSTKEARYRLAKSAGNLYILRTLLDKLAGDIFSDQRTWANFDDILEVERKLKAKLREREEEQLAVYVRDGLNDAESVNEWEPNASLALAIALASAREQGCSSADLHSEAQKYVRGWCDEVKCDSSLQRFTYDDEQFNEHLQVLQERRIFVASEFLSELFEAWLLGLRHGRQSNVEAWRTLLMKGAVRRVPCPEPLERLETNGSQARIWVYIAENVKYAVRKTSIRTQEERSRFLEEKGVLEALSKRMTSGEKGSEYIFKLAAVGLSADDDWEAIQIYRWVEGVDLSQKAGELRAAYITDIGVKLARALHFLHGAGILHRDLRPQNIILAEQTLDPVIIDFGFARRMADTGRTCLNDDWAAPEVRRESPTWSPAADVYSLGRTLRSILLSDEEHSVLLGVLDQCSSDDPEKRPLTRDLEKYFANVALELRVDKKKREMWNQVQELSRIDQGQFSWFGDILEKFKHKFEALTLGCGIAQFDRSRQVASFLSQVLEAVGRPELSRGRSKGKDLNTSGVTQEISLLHYMRTFDSHYMPNMTARMADFGNPDDGTIREMTIRGTQQISQLTNILSLPEIVELIL